MIDIEFLKQHPEQASDDDVLELIRLLELARNALPSHEGTPVSPEGGIGDVKSLPRQ